MSPSCPLLSLPIIARSSATRIHATRIALPPTNGANLNTAVTSGLAAVQVPAAAAAAEHAIALLWNHVILGSGDQGPVQAATTPSNTANGIHACATCPCVSPCPRVWCACARSTGTPPYPRTVLGCQTLSRARSATKHTIAPVTSGRYGPRYTATGYCPAM